MSENKDNNNYDSLKDVNEFQNNMFNPGHYIGTGKVTPTVSAPGNALPLAIEGFIVAAISLFMAIFLFFQITDTTDKIVIFMIFFVLSIASLFYGFVYLKKAKKYYKEKAALKSEYIDEETTDQLWQRTCPKCGETHDIDYPKCPNCKFDYLK